MNSIFFKWGLYNVTKKAGYFFQLMISMFLVFSLLSSGSVFSLYTDYLYKKTYVQFNDKLAMYAEIPVNFSYDTVDELKKNIFSNSLVSECEIVYQSNIFQYAGADFFEKVQDYSISLNIDDKTYDYSTDLPLMVNVFSDGGKPLLNLEINNFKKENNNMDVLLYGHYPSDSNEIMLSESLLSFVENNSEEMPELCGKKIQILIGNENIIEEKTISGIVRKEFYDDIFETNQVYFSEKTDGTVIDGSGIVLTFNDYDHDIVSYLKNDLFEKNGLEFEENYSCDVLSNISVQRIYTNKLLYVMMIAIMLVSVLNIVILMYVSLDKKSIAMLFSQGMTEKDIIKLKITELFYCIVPAVLLCYAFVSVAVSAFNSYIPDVFGIEGNVPLKIILTSVISVCITVSLFIIFIYALLNRRILKKYSISEMMRS